MNDQRGERRAAHELEKIAAAPQKMLVCERDRKVLTLYTRDKVDVEFDQALRYKVAIGAPGFNTPKGLYIINSRVKDPDWLMPNSPWVDPELRGTVIKGGDPNNPLKARWLGVTAPSDGVGIHGTADDASIGFAESHGCLRMHVDDVIELYAVVPVGTPIYID